MITKLAELPQPSVAVTVHCCVLAQAVPPTVPPLADNIGDAPELSVTEPASAIAIAAVMAGGLQPKFLFLLDPPANIGAKGSDPHPIVTAQLAKLPQESVAVTVHICCILQEVPVAGAKDAVITTAPQLSVTLPAFAIASAIVGGVVPGNICMPFGQLENTGLVTSDFHLYVTSHVAKLPQASVALTV